MTAFALTFARILGEQRAARNGGLIGALLALGAWSLWFVGGDLQVYGLSSQARVERSGRSYGLASPLVGRVVAVRFKLGDQVQRGDLLIALDSTADELALRRERTRGQGLEARLVTLRAQLVAERGVLDEQRKGARLGAREVSGLVREAEVAARVADKELSRLALLKQDGISPERELDKGRAEAELRRLTIDRLGIAAERVPQQQAAWEREWLVRSEQLLSRLAELEADRATSSSEAERLDYELERRRIRAPIDGHIAEAAILHEGYVVAEGERLGSIVPTGDYLVVAQYPAAAALGRIRAGQKARLRLQGFPSVEFGSVSTTVTRVAEDVRDGTVRVESRFDSGSTFRGTLEHGMPGTLEVTLERASPLSLVLRSAGQWLTTPP